VVLPAPPTPALPTQMTGIPGSKAGPLREPVAAAAARCQAAVLIGLDEAGALRALPRGLPVLRATLAAACAQGLGQRPVLAFAGIGRPEKFFRTVRALGADLVATRAFGDHHAYSESDATRLLDTAASLGATLVTTRKDYVRLPPPLQAASLVVEVRLAWDDEPGLRSLLAGGET
jgi:tetraacyldisaccharide 4'-kinase